MKQEPKFIPGNEDAHVLERLQRALEGDGFCLFRQRIIPLQVDSHGGEHYEFLLRLLDESGNWIRPADFLPAARRYNLSSRLDQWVVEAVLAWLAAHPEETQRLQWCSINLSAQSMADNLFLGHVIRQFVRSGVSPEKVCFEVDEIVASSNLSDTMMLIRSLKDRGCRFALDDFGSGLSAFSQLRDLPVDYLKIDGAFVKDIIDDPVALTIVRSIHDIGKVMGKRSIAEHVENEEVLRELKTMGVDYAQGYALGRPETLARVTTRSVGPQANP